MASSSFLQYPNRNGPKTVLNGHFKMEHPENVHISASIGEQEILLKPDWFNLVEAIAG